MYPGNDIGGEYIILSQLSEPEKEQILSLIDCGITYKVLAEEYGTNVNTIGKIKKAAKEAGRGFEEHGNDKLSNAVVLYQATEDENVREIIGKYVISPLVDKTKNSQIRGFLGEKRELLDSHTEYVETRLLEYVEEFPPSYHEKDYRDDMCRRLAMAIPEEIEHGERIESLKHRPIQRLFGGYIFGRKPELKELSRKILEPLTPREERVLRMRFGIGERSDHVLEQIGRDFTVTREKIRQAEAKALRKLRHPSRSKKLKSFVIKDG